MSLWRPELSLAMLGEGSATTESGLRLTAEQRLEGVATEFESWLAAQAPRRGARVSCVLGGDLVRYAVVPWVAELSSPTLRQRLAEQTFREAYGDVARGWTVCLHDQRHGAATLACATETALLDRLDALALARGLTVHSVQGALVQAFNATVRQLEAELCWFVLAEIQWTSLLLFNTREVLRVQRVPGGATPLPVLLDREWFALGLDAERPPVCVSRRPGVGLPLGRAGAGLGPGAGGGSGAGARGGAATDADAGWRFVELGDSRATEAPAEARVAA